MSPATEQARLRMDLNNKELEIAALRTENIAQNATIKTLQQSEVDSKRRIKKYKDRYREQQRLNNILVQSNHQIRILNRTIESEAGRAVVYSEKAQSEERSDSDAA